MKYASTKEFKKSLGELVRKGGRNKDAADVYSKVLGDWANSPNLDPIVTKLNRTKSKETRLEHCEKFVILERYRLITQRISDSRIMFFIGNHDESEKWLNRSRKETVHINNVGKLFVVERSNEVKQDNYVNKIETDHHPAQLLERIENQDDLDFILDDVPYRAIRKMQELDTSADDDDFFECINEINDEKKQSLLIDILDALRKGDLEGVKQRILAEKGEIRPLNDEVESIEVQSGEDIVVMDVGSQEYSDWITNYFENRDFFDWMLFMHPKQKEIVEEDYDGPTLLNGVSGSGKTGIIVKRAIRYASEKPEKPVLILTLNRSLTFLILDIINHACPKEFRKMIQVKSYFELCQDYLKEFEKADVFKHYSDVTWKFGDHIDDIWREFFRCQNNNDDARVFLEILKHFNERKIIGEKYLRDELDWIRSRFSKEDRGLYLDIERSGRLYPLLKEWRELILNGLVAWEEKMWWVGVTDYLGLSQKIMEHYSKLKPDYSHILVDEVQDFGLVELQIVRKLVEEGVNDIFMTGDENQKASAKFRSLSLSGIKVPHTRKKLIKKNYRNSKEILTAAHTIFEFNFHNVNITDEDFQILVPEYANFSYPLPQLIKGNNLQNEVNSALAYLKERLKNNKNKQACLAIAGFTTRELEEFTKRELEEFDIALLDGSLKENKSIKNKHLFISDLEQMKGFEFDYVVILNCSKGVIPNPNLTDEENMTNLKLLYISMTRAREYLGLSYSGSRSKWFDEAIEYGCFLETSWEEECEGIEIEDLNEPLKLEQINQMLKTLPYEPDSAEKAHPIEKPDIYDLNGFEFLYTEKAMGISLELQNRLEKYITGQDITRKEGQAEWQVEWSTINSAINDLKVRNIRGRQLFGAQETGWKEFMDTFNLFPERYN